MKKLRLFDSLKFVLATVACVFILNVAHADTSINSVIAYGKTEQSATPTPTNPVPIMTNNGVLKLGKNLFNKNTITVGYYYNPSGVYSTSSDGMVSNWIPISSNTTLTLTATIPAGGTKGSNRRVNYFDANKNWLSQTVSQVGSNNPTYTFTTPENTKYIRISWSYNGTYALDTDHAQLELGSTATAYEPYGTGVADDMVETIRDSAGHTATAQMLLGLNDTYRDEQNITTGAITRKVGVKVLDGTEDWIKNASLPDSSNAFALKNVGNANIHISYCSHFSNALSVSSVGLYIGAALNFILGSSSNITTVAQFKSWLADQYAAGTPVIVVYPLATETTESVATQTLTTAPVRQTAGSILGMPIEVVLGDGTREWVRDMITIATTKYNEEQFEPVQNRLSNAMDAVDDVVTRTMTQAQAIDQIATNKQTRPDEGCTAKYCLLVEDEDGTPHWYPIAGANGVAHNLPAGYTELQYIESTGTQYIDTGIIPTNRTSISAKATVLNLNSGPSFFGSLSGNPLVGLLLGTNSTGNGALFVNKTTDALNIQITANSIYEINLSGTTLSIQKSGEQAQTFTTTPIVETAGNIYMIGRNEDGVVKRLGAFKYYYMKIYENGVLVRDFVPAKNSNNVVGMYDLADSNPSTAFHTNAGTGTFTAGPDM